MWAIVYYYTYSNDDDGNNLIVPILVNGLRMTEEPEVCEGRHSVSAKLFHIASCTHYIS